MKIATFVTSLYSQGAEYVTASVARGLYDAGNEVEVVVTAIHNDLANNAEGKKPFALKSGMKLVQLPVRHARFSTLAFRKYIKNAAPDVLLCNASPYLIPMTLANLSLPKHLRTKIINVVHGSEYGLFKSKQDYLLRYGAIKGRIVAFLEGLADAVFAVSEGTRKMACCILNCSDERSYTVYNPVVDDVTVQKLSLPPSHPWLADKTCPVFVSAGALTGWKNFRLLIDAFARVANKSACRLIIFGEGPLRFELERQIEELALKDKVSLPGYTNQLPAEIKAADAFVVSSDVESFSVVLVEAMAAGVPIVSTEAPYGPPELLDGGRYGRLVPCGDANSLAAAMIDVLDKKVPVTPKERVDDFRIENIVKRYVAAIEKILQMK